MICRPRIKPKKGGVEDVFFVAIFIVAFALFFIILGKAYGSVKPELDAGLQSAMPSDSTVNVTITLDQTSSTVNFFDKMLPFLLLGLFAFVMIGGSLYFQHPIMLVVGIILLGVALLLGVVYANVYNEIASTDEFGSVRSDFDITDKFLQYLPFIVFIVFIVIAIFLWIRRGGGSAQI